jgi:hypothetical protein
LAAPEQPDPQHDLGDRAAARPPSLWRRVVTSFTAGDKGLALLALALVVYYRATRGIFQGKASGDGFFGFMFLPGLFVHHSLDLAVSVPEWAAILGRERTGLVANGCPIGPVVLWAPPYLLGLLLHKLAAVPVLGGLLRLLVPTLQPGRLSGREEADFFMAGLGSLAAGLWGLRLTFTFVARRLGVPAARFGVVGAVAATPLLFYLITQPLYQHACAFFGVALLVERWDAWRGQMTLRRWAALGAIGGVAMLMRQQEGLWFLLPGLDALGALFQALRRLDLRRAAHTVAGGGLFLLCALVVYSPQLLLWRYYYGELRPPQQPGHFIWWNPAIVESLFSMRAGLFPWVPVLYLVVPGLVLARRRLDGLVWRLGLIFALELWLNSSVWDFHGSWAYGPRRYTDSVGIVAVGLAGAYVTAAQGLPARLQKWATRGLVAALALLVLWNFTLAEQVRLRRIKSAAAGAYPASQWLAWVHAPPALGRLVDRVGFPFVQPVGWLYALWYHMPVSAFEGIVGNYTLERDWKVRSVLLTHGFHFAEPQSYLVAGRRLPPEAPRPADGMLPVQPQVRLMLPLMAREPLRVTLSGDLRGQAEALRLRWNGTALTHRVLPQPEHAAGAPEPPEVIEFEVPAAITHSRGRLNELVIDQLPDGARLLRLDVAGTASWWLR